VAAHTMPDVTDELTATVCWLSERPLRRGARLLVKHGTRTVPAIVTDLLARFDEQRLCTVDGPQTLVLNEIGRVGLRTAEPLPLDPYTASRRTGAFLVIDPADGGTLAAGLVGGRLPVPEPQPTIDAEGCTDDGGMVAATTPSRDLTSPGP
jgi:sulfate adenylyltransferase subunit 1